MKKFPTCMPKRVSSIGLPRSMELRKIIYNTAVRLNGEGHIHLLALYAASPRTNFGRPVEVLRTMITARKLLKLRAKPQKTSPIRFIEKNLTSFLLD